MRYAFSWMLAVRCWSCGIVQCREQTLIAPTRGTKGFSFMNLCCAHLVCPIAKVVNLEFVVSRVQFICMDILA